MRLPRYCKYLLVAIIVNIIILIILSFWQQNITDKPVKKIIEVTTIPPAILAPSITFIYQDFDMLNNVISETVQGIAKNFSDINILVLSKTFPYPPIDIPDRHNIKLITLISELNQRLNDSRPEQNIRSNYILFMPDGVSISYQYKRKLQQQLREMASAQSPFVFVIPVEGSKWTCHGLSVDYRHWTIQIGDTLRQSSCSYVTGDHGILLRTQDLYLLADPFLIPTFMSLYIQLSVVNIKPAVLENIFLHRFKKVKSDAQSVWQLKQSYNEKLKQLHSHLGVKRVIHANGKTDWYGCSKETNRCFDTVYDMMPEYLYHWKWTPPCCLKALRETAQYVFMVLESCKVRFWLEGGSLLGAVRYKDIIPWDYDIDIGIYKEDMIKCPVFSKLKEEAWVSEEGFTWEKAIEGEFYRVQYSETNHMHVDIFPFYSKNGVMTKETWFKTHRQDTEFPEHFLRPLTQIEFAGLKAPAPNNVRKFLEYKFGKGVIESPKYPDGKLAV